MLLLVPTRLEAERLLDGPVPADERPIASGVGGRAVHAALVGFGPFAAGVLAARAFGTGPEGPCVLAGLAGSYDAERLPVGALFEATEVGIEDAGAAGFSLVEGTPSRAAIRDRIGLGGPWGRAHGLVSGALLTVARASASPEEAASRGGAHGALAEDMEGFPVALAARLANRPLRILRAVSNLAGQGDRSAWRIDEPLRRLAGHLGRIRPGTDERRP
jgi:futalosine hydrolase